MILKKYKPKGVLITIQKDAIQLWDLERDYDQVNNSCKRVCQLVFSQQSSLIYKCAYHKGILILMHSTCGYPNYKFSAISLNMTEF